VPRLFIDDLLQNANDDENLLKNVITSDETWVYGYDVESKQQSSHWKSPVSPCSKKDTVHYEFALEGQKINQDFYLVVLRCLQHAVRRK
jgi:hypothetical protein